MWTPYVPWYICQHLERGIGTYSVSLDSGRYSGVPVFPLMSFSFSGTQARKPHAIDVTLLSLFPSVIVVGLNSSRVTMAVALSHAYDSYTKL